MNIKDVNADVSDLRKISLLYEYCSRARYVYAFLILSIPIAILFNKTITALRRGNLERLKYYRLLFIRLRVMIFCLIPALAFTLVKDGPALEHNIATLWLTLIISLVLWRLSSKPVEEGYNGAISFLSRSDKATSGKVITALSSTPLATIKHKNTGKSGKNILWALSSLFSLISKVFYSAYLFFIIFIIFMPVLSLMTVSSNLENVAKDAKNVVFELIILDMSQALIIISLVLFLPVVMSTLFRFFRSLAEIKKFEGIDKYRVYDERKPILFLRAFIEGRVKIGKSQRPFLFRNILGDSSLKNIEGILVNKFWGIAPVYALAKPGSLPVASGAVKSKLKDQDWKEEIAKLIQSSKYICLAVSDTESISWEVDEIQRKNCLEKTLFIFKDGISRESEIIHNIGLAVTPENTKDFKNIRAVFFRNGHWNMVNLNDTDSFSFVYLLSYFMFFYDEKISNIPGELSLNDKKSITKLGTSKPYNIFLGLLYFMVFWYFWLWSYSERISEALTLFVLFAVIILVAYCLLIAINGLLGLAINKKHLGIACGIYTIVAFFGLLSGVLF